MKHLILPLFLLVVTHAHAQNKKSATHTVAKKQPANKAVTQRPAADTSNARTKPPITDTGANLPRFTYVEKMPKAGYIIQEYLTQNMHYPDTSIKYGVEGRVIVKFIVEETGAISNVSVVKGLDKYCDEEAVRVVSRMPPWVPGTQEGKPVKVFFTLPITFKLTD